MSVRIIDGVFQASFNDLVVFPPVKKIVSQFVHWVFNDQIVEGFSCNPFDLAGNVAFLLIQYFELFWP